ncbi:peptidoglycan editing factor PgeF [Pontivivens ytuae]|uniref:Purine nucleoside phosphorylase n=1 Tax=Pontivivens ytuae TaxID=2789856 RepID=A0A7S9LTB8_9RHOB|nr:peptidoglycan editing factor PgeF [Pontivivens ytuae]QPH54909.1 peptidoglycan editing factor PgeF [Pontivivens ytuae]
MTLEILASDLLSDVRHGFFTRRGGASSGIFAGLNCGPGSSDQSEAVRINRARVADAMDVDCDRLISLAQIHSPDVVTLDTAPGDRPQADAMVTAAPGLVLGILTADCAPVLLADREAGVVGAAHAGWKGALGGVLESTVSAMERLGARADAIRATVGPTISQRNYEVGQDFMERFVDEDTVHSRFFVHGREPDKVQFDLPGFVLHRLRSIGVDAEWTGHCTYAEPDRFYSYRRATHLGEADYGRLIACIRL